MYNWKKHLRVLFGFVLGVFAGISISTSIYPMVVSSLGAGLDSIQLLLFIDPWSMHIATVWGIGMAALAWTGGHKFGMAVLGVVGLVTGLFLGIGVLGIPTVPMLLGTVISTTYGIVGGFILGKFWPDKA